MSMNVSMNVSMRSAESESAQGGPTPGELQTLVVKFDVGDDFGCELADTILARRQRFKHRVSRRRSAKRMAVDAVSGAGGCPTALAIRSRYCLSAMVSASCDAPAAPNQSPCCSQHQISIWRVEGPPPEIVHRCRRLMSWAILMIYFRLKSLPLIPSFGALFQRDAAGLMTGRGTRYPSPSSPSTRASTWASTRSAQRVISCAQGLKRQESCPRPVHTSKVTLRSELHLVFSSEEMHPRGASTMSPRRKSVLDNAVRRSLTGWQQCAEQWRCASSVAPRTRACWAIAFRCCSSDYGLCSSSY